MPASAGLRPTPLLPLAVALAALSACGKAPVPQGPFIPTKVSERPVYVVELGDDVAGLANRIVRLCSEVNVIAIPLKPRPLDPRGMDPGRHAFAADSLVEDVRRQEPVMAASAGTIIIAVTAADMFVREQPERPFTPAWETGERFAVISVRPLDPARTGAAADPALLETRLRKVLFRTLGRIFFQLPVPADAKGLMRPALADLAALDALPNAFTEEDLNPPAPPNATAP